MKDGKATRRFHTLRIIMVAAGLILTARILHIQIIQHEHYKGKADRQWGEDVALPAERGNLYDRHGRPLALSVTKWQIGVSKGYIDETGPLCDMLGEVLGRRPADVRRSIARAKGNHVVLARDVVLTTEQQKRLIQEGQQAVTADPSCSRVYPTDGVGASLIGFYRPDPDGDRTTGLEMGLDGYLAGKAGLARELKAANPNQDLGVVPLREAVHGRSMVLTLDSDLQAICEENLRERIAESGSIGGSVLMIDPRNGDVLAAASWPLMETRAGRHGDGRVWQNRNFTYQFEPGSVFKIFTTASLLRHGAIDTATVYRCDKVKGDGIYVNNDRRKDYGNLSLMSAFSLSSNVYFAKAVGNLRDREFYRDIKYFGFGQETMAPYPGQEGGLLRDPAVWSGRSKQTLSIGQEMTVTAIQLGMAVAAVANGGELYAPRMVKEIRNDRGEVIEKVQPVPLRRVMASPLAELLQEAMGRVVSEGTGVSAGQDWLAVGGKTGTAQKVREGETKYTAYIATFAGVAPLEDPRLVVVTVLDEPSGIYHYAAQSAAPLFKDIVADVRGSTDWLTDAPGNRMATFVPDREDQTVEVPDVLLLSSTRAAAVLAEAGLVAAGTSKDGQVVQQVPAAGTRCRTGQTVTLAVAGREEAAPQTVIPDFAGLSNRQVQSLASRLGIPVKVRGVGYAVEQDVKPGNPLGGRPVTVRMQGSWR